MLNLRKEIFGLRGNKSRLIARRAISLLSCVMLVILTACQIFPALEQIPVRVSTETPSVVQTPSQITPTVGEPSTPTDASPGPVTLRVWLPAQFDPSTGTPAGELFSARLDEFMDQNADVHIEVRLKALDGPGGLLESLAAASAAAPMALPDLIALPRPLLESAALKGLLFPYDGISEVMGDDSWYDYARQLARIQESIFGLPFAGDAQVLAYRPVAMEVPPRDWESALSLGNPVAYPAADIKALFTLNQYQAFGGAVWDQDGRPMLDEAILVQVLSIYQKASQAGVMPVWLTQLETDEQVWQALAEEQAVAAVVWASNYLSQSDDLNFETMISTPITRNGDVHSMATGWVWALASPDVARRQLSAQLAEFLVEAQFLSEWNNAAGYLPPHIDSLAEWGDEELRTLVGRISMTAQLVPSEDLLASLGPALEEAVVLVLKQQADPQTAAQAAAERVSQP